MDVGYKIFGYLLAVGILVTFHELGHYLVGRWCGVKVLRFSLGFGTPLFIKRFGRDGTEWVLSAIPLGGYVRFVDEREGPVAPADEARAFNRQSPWKRMAIAAAGPVVNLILAAVLYAGLYVHGIEGDKAQLADPLPDTPVARAGFRSGDEIVAINDTPVQSWQDLRWRLLNEAGSKAPLAVQVREAQGVAVTRTLALDSLAKSDWEQDFIRKLGFQLYRPPIPAVIAQVSPGKPADLAGLRAGDKIIAVENEPIVDWQALSRQINAAKGQRIEIEYQRAGRTERLRVRPEAMTQEGQTSWIIGIRPEVPPELLAPYRVTTRYGLLDAAQRGMARMVEMSVFTLRMLGKIVTGEASLRNVSGPLTMADVAGQSIKLGPVVFANTLALISIGLGVLNLLPIPLLDGGHLLYYSLEAIRGRPLSERAWALGQQVGMAILFALMGLAFYNDFVRFFVS